MFGAQILPSCWVIIGLCVDRNLRETTGGVLSPEDDAGKPKGKTVMEVLQPF